MNGSSPQMEPLFESYLVPVGEIWFVKEKSELFKARGFYVAPGHTADVLAALPELKRDGLQEEKPC